MSVKVIFSIALVLTSIDTVFAHRQACPEALKQIQIDRLIPTQTGIRRPFDELKARFVYIQQKRRLPKPAILFQTPEGHVYIRDGHHDIELAKEAGLLSLDFNQGDFIFEQWSPEEFNSVNLSAGWVTPMKLGQDFRRAELAGWKKLLGYLRDYWTPKKIENFIHLHPEAYLHPNSKTLPSDTTIVHLSSRDPEEYQEYLRKMDLTMPMKIGQLLPAFPSDGILIDNGFGTGQQSFAYALYNPNLLVVGQDIALQAVNHAASQFQLPNLVFLEGNVLEARWPENFADAIVESSFTHEIFSYGEPALDLGRVERMRSEAFRYLKEGGTYGFRDFVRPDWPKTVVLHLPTEKRTGTAPYGHLSLADLFEDFVKTHIDPMIQLDEILFSKPGYRTFRISGTQAANFLLRMNYTNQTSWESERKEQYIYSSAKGNIRSFREKGFRVDYAAPVENHWMIRNWWEKEGIVVEDLDGNVLPWPHSNFVLYATKPFPGDPLSISVDIDRERDAPQWMNRVSFKNKKAQHIDMVRVPGETKVFVPFEKNKDGLFIWLRRSMPLYGQHYYSSLSRINLAHYQGFGVGPIARLFEKELSPGEAFQSAFLQKVGGHIEAPFLNQMPTWTSSSYLSSPGATNESITNVFIDIEGEATRLFDPLRRETKRVKLEQLLAASHLGAINDPRLEIAAYALGIKEGALFFPWIGPQLVPTNQSFPKLVRFNDYESLLNPRLTEFTRTSKPTQFMNVREVVFKKELTNDSADSTRMEFILPATRSVDTFSVIPYAKIDSEILVGLESRSLPSFQINGFGSKVPVIPAWRISKEAKNLQEARNELKEKMAADFGLQALDILPLGEGYFPSAGQTPEKVQPHAVEIDLTAEPRDLLFIPLKVLLEQMESIPDLHTRLGIYRLAHALGFLQ